MITVLRSHHYYRRLSERLRRDRKGATAVEFAIVALPFFALMAAIMETALVFFATIMMEHGLAQSAREIRTGQLQVSGGSAASFRDTLCSRTGPIIDCGRVEFDVRTLASFGGAPGLPLDGDGQLDGNAMGFAPGDAGDIVMVRAFYEWQLIMPNLGLGLSNMSGNKRLLTATIAFRNEPFQDDL
ncbi:MAG: pilus assembly protein [Oceanicaulis sp.]|uniref:TadE/TadG family type IV pilus assembly protein n=1 Tax=Glycocaulis sp. TaxID=1969725 RepID=UPI0025C1DE02|nr:TadE/TadG family type IV pilus assembly protein [Glycocaulis sp.]MCC5982557.1 pilus assembly protein [Oceanicaulis sp.]MCH8522686.1 pilus assembly protein [Glycocaulis sp.]